MSLVGLLSTTQSLLCVLVIHLFFTWQDNNWILYFLVMDLLGSGITVSLGVTFSHLFAATGSGWCWPRLILLRLTRWRLTLLMHSSEDGGWSKISNLGSFHWPLCSTVEVSSAKSRFLAFFLQSFYFALEVPTFWTYFLSPSCNFFKCDLISGSAMPFLLWRKVRWFCIHFSAGPFATFL